MGRLQVGMWEGFNRSHWDAYSSEWTTGIELSQSPDERRLQECAEFCAERGFGYGIHTPVMAGGAYMLPKVTSIDRADREEALARIRSEAETAAKYEADYVLFHYPYPSLFPARQDSRYIAGMPVFEHYEAGDATSGQLAEWGDRLFSELSELQTRVGQRLVLEHDFLPDNGIGAAGLFAKYPDIGLVVDVSRLDVQKRCFPGFDPYAWLASVHRSIYLVHYSNTRYSEPKWARHLPVMPEHDEDEQYGDAYAYLKFIVERNKEVHVTFEHNPSLVSRERLEQCHKRAAGLFGA